MAQVYRTIMRGFLPPMAIYYVLVTLFHWRSETGITLLVLAGISGAAVCILLAMRRMLSTTQAPTMARMEAVGLVTNLLVFANVTAFLLVHPEPGHLIYFVLAAIVFATSSVTLRVTIASITVTVASLYAFARDLVPDQATDYAWIGLATAFASVGTTTLLRRAVARQIEARLRADDMAAAARDLAARDGLTGLANRRALFERLESLVRDGLPFWLGLVDLDGFKSVNDVYGHKVGDSLLMAAASRLSAAAPDGALLGRIGGDEFVIVIEGAPPAQTIMAAGDQLIASVSRPCEVGLLNLAVSASVGFARFPDMADSLDRLYEKADFALYRAKQRARGRTLVFDAAEDVEMRENLSLEAALREADFESELHLVFQPQVEPATGAISACEALARWDSPTLGSVPPDRFIRAAERMGLINRITTILFDKGLQTLETWPAEVAMSFNLSAQDLSDRALIFSLAAKVFTRGIDPRRVEFEITETAVMTDIDAARRLLEDLAAVGFRIALDDFGSGYSSFEYFDQLPLSKVKLDKSFVRKVAHSDKTREIVAGIIDLCRKLKLQCVLEGVETNDQLAILRPLGPATIQGYLFARPMPAEQILERIRPADLETVRKAG